MEQQEYYKMYHQENNFWWYRILHNIVLTQVKKRQNHSLKIFDAGCGTGRMVELLLPYGEISGVDFSEDAVRYSKDRGLENIEQGDLNDYSFVEKNAFDVIISLDVLCHKSIRSEKEIFQKFYEALDSKGQLILNLPAFNFLKRNHDEFVHTKHRYTRKKLIKELENVGFKVQKSTYRMPILFCIIILQKIIRKIIKPKEVTSDLYEIPKFIDNTFYFLGDVENKYISWGGFIPFGSSLFVVAVKK